MDDEPKTQTFINQANGQLVDVVALYHTEARQDVVFMDDILNAFGVTALTIMNGTASVPFARQTSYHYHYFEPRCILHQPNVNLTVIIGEQHPPNSNPGRPRTPAPVSDNDSTLYEDSAGPAEPLNFDRYAESLGFSEMESNRGDGVNKVGPRLPLEVRTEVDVESELDMDEINEGVGRLEFEESGPFVYHHPDGISTAHPVPNSSSPDNNNNNLNGAGMGRSITPPLSTSSSDSGTTTGSGVSTSSATNIPPSAIETATSGTTAAASGTTAVPEPTEIDPVEATSSWASIFRTLGDLQEQYQLTPEETTKMFTEITQSA